MKALKGGCLALVEVRSKIRKLIDYCGDIDSGRTDYNPNYSPNNIRRIVISPNGVFVVYHKSNPSTGGKTYNYVEFQDKDLYFEEQQPKYKPILDMLANPLVCASLEEIVVLRQSLSGHVHQNFLNEIQLEVMVKSFRGDGSDLKEKITRRFARLRYYSVLDANFKAFLTIFKTAVQTKEISRYPFFSEIPTFKSRCQTTVLAGDDYWKYNGCLAHRYAYDAVLKAHFDAIRKSHEDKLKADKVDELRDKRLGGKIAEVNAKIEEYIAYNRLWSTYYNIIRKEGPNGVLPNLSFVKAPEAYEVLPFKGMVKVPEMHLSKQQVPEQEALERNEAMFKSYKLRCASSLVQDFLTALERVADGGEEILLKVLVGGCEAGISVPTNYKGTVEKIKLLTGVEFAGRDIQATVVLCCSQFIRFFVDCDFTDAFSKPYWEGKLKKVGG